eukprot:TRINITY_DN14666_c0_g2_i1.p1 TRINITY_DN14666_c0_g2~~TRINITY_DN14666_c0_g2_i1.p1  ORF type:complete len:124 (-),score=20.11 TRINITY_DN14666_c0_g2_i1:52-423(-)
MVAKVEKAGSSIVSDRCPSSFASHHSNHVEADANDTRAFLNSLAAWQSPICAKLIVLVVVRANQEVGTFAPDHTFGVIVCGCESLDNEWEADRNVSFLLAVATHPSRFHIAQHAHALALPMGR